MGAVDSEWEDIETIADEFLDAGDDVVVALRYRGRGRGSGVEVSDRTFEVHTFRDGVCVRKVDFTERSEALQAAGLSEHGPFRVTSVRFALVNAERDLDVVVFGATGVTGRQVAAYLAEHRARAGAPPGAIRRSSSAMLAEVGAEPPETIVADVGDPASLAAMAVARAGGAEPRRPLHIHGRPVIEACVERRRRTTST